MPRWHNLVLRHPGKVVPARSQKPELVFETPKNRGADVGGIKDIDS